MAYEDGLSGPGSQTTAVPPGKNRNEARSFALTSSILTRCIPQSDYGRPHGSNESLASTTLPYIC